MMIQQVLMGIGLLGMATAMRICWLDLLRPHQTQLRAQIYRLSVFCSVRMLLQVTILDTPCTYMKVARLYRQQLILLERLQMLVATQ
jgi:hypothetical protein